MALYDSNLENALTCEMYGCANVDIDFLSKADPFVLRETCNRCGAGIRAGQQRLNREPCNPFFYPGHR